VAIKSKTFRMSPIGEPITRSGRRCSFASNWSMLTLSRSCRSALHRRSPSSSSPSGMRSSERSVLRARSTRSPKPVGE